MKVFIWQNICTVSLVWFALVPDEDLVSNRHPTIYVLYITCTVYTIYTVGNVQYHY